MHLRPERVADAVSFLADTGAAILAGGTDFYPALGDRPLRRDILDIAGIDEIAGIDREGDGWRIGAGATWTDLRRAKLPPQFDGLIAAARELGSIQIQNAATISGSALSTYSIPLSGESSPNVRRTVLPSTPN